MILTAVLAFVVGGIVGALLVSYLDSNGRTSKREWVRPKSLRGARGYVIEKHSEGFVVKWPENYGREDFYRWNQAFLEFADDWLHEEARARIEAGKTEPTKATQEGG